MVLAGLLVMVCCSRWCGWGLRGLRFVVCCLLVKVCCLLFVAEGFLALVDMFGDRS